MYNEHFGLQRAPFKITPDTRLFYPGGSRGEVLEALVYAITSGEGIVKVVGEVGSGKTMLCRMLEEHLPENVQIVYLANPSLSPEDTLHAIAMEMKLDVDASANRLQVMHALQQRLLEKHAQHRQVVVFIEEAQSMPIATLEEIRLLSNLETKHDKLLQIVLFGQPELDENLEQPDIRQLNERITHSFYLQPFSPEQTREYVNYRLRAVGYRGPDMFRSGAYRHIVHASAGLTRRINILADKALLAAFADDTHDVSKRHVKIAIDDSQFARHRRWGLPEVSLVSGLILIVAAVVWTLTQRDGVAFERLSTLLSGGLNQEQSRPAASTNTADAEVTTADARPAVQQVSESTSQEPSPMPSSAPAESPAEDVNRDAAPAAAPATIEIADAPPAHASTATLTDRLAESEVAENGGSSSETVHPVEAPAAPLQGTLAPPLQETMAATGDVGRLLLSDSLSRLPDSTDKAAAGDGDAASGTTAASREQAGSARQAPAATVVAAVTPVAVPGGETSVSGGGQYAVLAPDAPSLMPDADIGPLTVQRLVATRDWLQAANGRHFSIQLLLTDHSRRSNLEAFLRDRQLAGEIGDYYVYETRIRSRIWYGVLYREFATLGEARAALENLPSELRLHQPFIRNVRDIASMG